MIANTISSLRHLTGKRVLDVGCGYGTLVDYLRSQGYQAEGVDFDPVSVEAAHKMFPAATVRLENAETMERYPTASFDSIVLKDALHHLVCEGDFRSSSQMFRRILVPGGRLVVLDPHPMWILKLARRLASHDDVEVDPQRALEELRKNGFDVSAESPTMRSSGCRSVAARWVCVCPTWPRLTPRWPD